MTIANDPQHSARQSRLGFRIDQATRDMIAHAARLERRKLTEFCTGVLAEAARRTIAQHETLTLSDRDRAIFFATLIEPPPQNDRLKRAFAAHADRVIE